MFRRRGAGACMLIVALACTAAESQDALPTAQALERLAGAVWKERPNVLDITVLDEITTKPPSRAELRSDIEKFQRELDEAQGRKRPEGEFQAAVEKELRRKLSEPHGPRVFKRRVVTVGTNQRIDQTLIEQAADHEAPFAETLGNVAATGEHEAYGYNIQHRRKSGQIGGSRWKEARYADLGGFSHGSRLLLQMAMGRFELDNDGKPLRSSLGGPVIVPDDEKTHSLSSGSSEAHRLTIEARQDEQGRETHIITLYFKGMEFPLSRWTLDAENYDICYREEFFNPQDGSRSMLREAQDFQPVEGGAYLFPRKALLIEYEKDGSVKTQHTYAVEKVAVNTQIGQDFFEFNVPPDYTTVDFRFEKPVIAEPVSELADDLADDLADEVLIPAAAETAEPSDEKGELRQPQETPDVEKATEREAPAAGDSKHVWWLSALAAGVAALLVVAWRISKRRR